MNFLVPNSCQRCLMWLLLAAAIVLAGISFYRESSVLLSVSALVVNLGLFLSVTISAKRQHDALKMAKEAEERFDLAVKGTSDAIWDYDLKKNEVYLSDRWYEMLGLSPDDFESSYSTWEKRVHPDDHSRVIEMLNGFLEGKNSVFYIDYRLLHKDGSYRWILSRGKGLRDAQGQILRMAGSNTDITEQKLAAEMIENQRAAMVASAKMSALGEMAGGVAHEINNPLAIISIATGQMRSLLERRNESIGEEMETLERIESTCFRVAKIIKALRGVCRDGSRDPFVATHARSLIQDTVLLCAEKFRVNQIDFKVELEEDDLEIDCRPVEISQVLLNLLNNAFDAVQHSERKEICLSMLRKKGQVCISVRDSGSGLSPEIQHRILEPFFTTKKVGEGTGLGLSISHEIVRRHSGKLLYDSLNPGAIFTIELPCNQFS